MASRSKSGGGIRAKVVGNKREATRERPRVRGANVTAVVQTGLVVGTHATGRGDFPLKREPLHRGPNFQSGVKFGNELATNVGAGGPGAGREILRSGSQCLHGKPVGTPKPPSRDTLAEFGPDRKVGG